MSIRCLAVLLFHNDEDLVADQIEYYKYKNNHDIIVFNHNSTDNTKYNIEKYSDDILCIYELSYKINFANHEVFDTIFKILDQNSNIKKNEIKISNKNGYNLNFKENYDWISFPESDEFLEGPDRKKTFYEYLCDIHNKKEITSIKYLTFTYWFTEKDDMKEESPIKRIKYYCVNKPGDTSLYEKKSNYGNSSSKQYTWRANKIEKTFFGHCGIIPRKKFLIWNTRHYEIRKKKHLINKLKDRADNNDGCHHYKIMNEKLKTNSFYDLKSDELYFDDGINDLNMNEKFNWTKIYPY